MIIFEEAKNYVLKFKWCKCGAKHKSKNANPFAFNGLAFSFAVWTGLEPATPCVTGRYSNQTELPHQKFRGKDNTIF